MKTLCDIVARWMGAWVLLVAVVAFLKPEPLAAVDTWWINPLLGVIMFGMGLTLSANDFRIVLSHPRDVAVGCLAQFVVMPSVAWLLTLAFALPKELALGVMLVGCCPGGTASNVITFLARGDLALSVGMTACSTLLAPLLTPLLVWLLAGTMVEVDTVGMLLSIVYVVIAPIVAGLLCQRFLPTLTRRAMPYLPAFSSLMITLVVGIIVSHNAERLFSAGLLVIAVVVLHNLCGLALGYATGRLLRLPHKKCVAISIEVGMQNSGLASSLAVLHFAAFPLATVPGAIFSVWHNISGALVAKWYGREHHTASKRLLLLLLLPLAAPFHAHAASRILSPDIKSLRVMVGDDFLSPPVLTLGRGEVLNISFDQMSHQYHRYIYHLELCDADWQPTTGLFENDFLEGFNDNPIEDYAESEGTNVLYTHYSLQLPNERCRPKLSGNYRLHILDDDNGGEEVAVAEFYIVRPLVLVGLGVTTNTDIGLNQTAQQVSMSVRYQDLRVTRPDEQLRTVVRQNNREDTERRDVPPTFSTPQGLSWEHSRGLIFPGGNEYHKFEMLDNDHPSMGVDRITWDGENYHAYPVVCEPRRHYLYDEDADGAYYIRNSDNWYNDTQSDYLWVHYKLYSLPRTLPVQGASVVLQGQWTIEPQENYVADYDAEDKSYNVAVMQKQGYYNYQFLLRDFDGTTHPMPEEGNFYQTENRYQAFVYYRPQGGRSWLLVGYQQIVHSS